MSVVRSNINSMNANRNLSKNNGLVTKSLEKLASGYQINRAGDDASGLAISEKMKSQIEGLKQASENAQDGISLVKVAEGALNEIHSMLNRMTELSVQASNGTINDEVDREAVQAEFEVLCDEIDRVSQSTNFNGIYVFEGQVEEYTYDVLTHRQVALSDIDADRDIVYDVPGLDITIYNGVFGIDFLVNQDTGDIVITSNTPLVVEGTDVSSITIKTDNAVLALHEATVESTGSSAINVGNNNLTLYLEGNNTVGFYEKEDGTVPGSGSGIEVGSLGSLTIQGPGNVDVTGTGDNAAIGSPAGDTCGSIIINSGDGVVTATSTGHGAAIGSGAGGSVYGNLIMMSGTITATTPEDIDGEGTPSNGAAIGSGAGGDFTGNLVIAGDDDTVVTATSYGTGAAIGTGGDGNFDGTLAILGGTTNATANGDGAAIGIGANGSLTGILVIDGADTNVTATAEGDGAAIGTGAGGEIDGNIVILDAKEVNATATGNGAGIGTGANGSMTGDIGIVGGTIDAKATTGAAIGTGQDSDFTGNIQIKDATIKAEATSGAGIGSGSASGTGSSNFTGNIEITQSDDPDAETKITATAVNGAAIGSGSSSTFTGNIIIAGGNDGVGDPTTIINAKTTGNGAAIGSGAYSTFSTGSVDDDGNVVGGILLKDADITAITLSTQSTAIGSGSYSTFNANIMITETDNGNTNITAIGIGNSAAIGSGRNSATVGEFNGDIVIAGGTVTAINTGLNTINTNSIESIIENANTSGGSSAAIGVSDDSTMTGNIIIAGDDTTVNAYGGEQAAGIGTGRDAALEGNIIITGGTIDAQGGTYGGAGIGTGQDTSSPGVAQITGSIVITGGTISATGGSSTNSSTIAGAGAGIGTGDGGSIGGGIIITDAIIDTAEGGSNNTKGVGGAGIGTGSNGTIGDGITITGTEIGTVTGGTGSAGIGTGSSGTIGGDDLDDGIFIEDTTIGTVTGGAGGAGIGTGEDGTIMGNVTVSGSNGVAQGGTGGAGIGTGVNGVVDGTVTEGNVTANAGSDAVDSTGVLVSPDDVGKGVDGEVNKKTYTDAIVSIPSYSYNDVFDVDFDFDYDFMHLVPEIDTSAVTGYITVTDKKTMFGENYNWDDLILQIGDTNDIYQKVSVPIINMRHTSIGLTGASMSTEELAGASLELIINAISYVSEHRSTLGSLHNRLEYTVNNLDNAVENISASNSRIRDTDMAEQMMQYTKMGILVQSAQTMLAKSNEEAKGVLNLLG